MRGGRGGRGEETEGVMQMDTLIPRSLPSFREMASLVFPGLLHFIVLQFVFSKNRRTKSGGGLGTKLQNGCFKFPYSKWLKAGWDLELVLKPRLPLEC